MNKEQLHLKKKYNQTGAKYSGWGCWGYYYDEDKGIYRRINHGPTSKYFKKWGNKKIRHHKDVGNWSNYKRLTMSWKWWW